MEALIPQLAEYGIIGVLMGYLILRDWMMTKKINAMTQSNGNGKVAKHETDIALIRQDLSYMRKDMSDAVRRIEKRLERIEQNQANRMRPEDEE